MGGVRVEHPMIQASSLSDVQAVADAPPTTPSLRRVGGAQLILYIARVPGSPDIFLTTLKPREKTVTAHDVESSLYYCHMESEQDGLLMEGDELLDGVDNVGASDLSPSSPEDEESSRRPPPVPPHAELPGIVSEPPALPQRPSFQPSAVIKRKPVGVAGTEGSHIGNSAEQPATQLPPLPLRPAGPRSMERNSDSAEDFNRCLDLGIKTDLGRQAPPLPRRPVSVDSPTDRFDPAFLQQMNQVRPWQRDFGVRPETAHASASRSPHSFDGAGLRRPSATQPPLSPRSTTSSLTRTSSMNSAYLPGSPHEGSSKGFNVTLIRRDPATGTQSNIGKITIPALSSRYARSGKALLQLFNPGYEKFRIARGTSTADLVRCISEDDGCTYSCDLRLATRRRSLRSPSAPYFGDVPVNQLISVTPSQPYSFISPWNRVCEFSTGMSGRSLRCRHMLARGTLQEANMNEMSVVTLSELRFNTPSTNLFTKVSPKRNRRPHGHSASTGSVDTVTSSATIAPPLPPRHNHHNHHQLLGKVAAGVRTSHDNSSRSTFDTTNFDSSSAASSGMFANDDNDGQMYSDDDVEPMNLALGQERAGGGLRGNKAKLGKLVIEPEGLEMLDLLVAANMGVWWSIR